MINLINNCNCLTKITSTGITLLVFLYQDKLKEELLIDKLCFFNTEEVRRLEAEVSHQQKDYELLLEENLQAINKIEQLNRLHSDQKLQIIEDVKKIKELQRELEAKEELVRSSRTHTKSLAHNELREIHL